MIHERIYKRLLDVAQGHTVTDVVVGLGYTAVEVDGEALGISYTFAKELNPVSCTVFKKAGSLREVDAIELVEGLLSYSLLDSSLSLALANALLNRPTDGGDFLGELRGTDKVVMVGYFGPLIPVIEEKCDRLIICERDSRKGVLPDYAAYTELRNADVVVLSATTLINKTVDTLLMHSESARVVALVGPSCLMDKAVFENTPVTHLCGVTIGSIDRAKEIISQGGGTVALKECTRKECVVLEGR